MSKWPGNAGSQHTTFGDLKRSELMGRVRSAGNRTTELRLMHLLREAHLSGWRRHVKTAGHPDFIWRETRTAVFVDGCFWHGHTCGKQVRISTNAVAWEKKIAATRSRDRRVVRELRASGWNVIRIWECQLRKKPDACVAKIRKALAKRVQ
jgi:DNA mismatch endonuclease (patch repair protein)